MVLSSINKLCRVCLQPGLYDIFDNSLLDLIPRSLENLDVKLEFVTSLQIIPVDNYPRMLCKPCVVKLNAAYLLKDEAIGTNEKIISFLQSNYNLKIKRSPVESIIDESFEISTDEAHSENNVENTMTEPQTTIHVNMKTINDIFIYDLDCEELENAQSLNTDNTQKKSNEYINTQNSDLQRNNTGNKLFPSNTANVKQKLLRKNSKDICLSQDVSSHIETPMIMESPNAPTQNSTSVKSIEKMTPKIKICSTKRVSKKKENAQSKNTDHKVLPYNTTIPVKQKCLLRKNSKDICLSQDLSSHIETPMIIKSPSAPIPNTPLVKPIVQKTPKGESSSKKELLKSKSFFKIKLKNSCKKIKRKPTKRLGLKESEKRQKRKLKQKTVGKVKVLKSPKEKPKKVIPRKTHNFKMVTGNQSIEAAFIRAASMSPKKVKFEIPIFNPLFPRVTLIPLNINYQNHT